jgi:hypothetical protein
MLEVTPATAGKLMGWIVYQINAQDHLQDCLLRDSAFSAGLSLTIRRSGALQVRSPTLSCLYLPDEQLQL